MTFTPPTAPDELIVPVTDRTIDRAARILRKGGLVAFPTETVYGLAAGATSDRAVAAIFKAKERPQLNPLIIHFASESEARRHVVFDERAARLAAAFWPGPLTLVLPRRARSRISLLASAGLDTLGVRVPDHEVARALLERTAHPLAAPSANRSGSVSPTTAAHVRDSLGDSVDLILDAGPCRVGLESAVLDLTGAVPALLRPGGLTREAIEAILGPVPSATAVDGAPKSPGRLQRHYAPRHPLRLNATAVRPGEALLAFGAHAIRGAVADSNLSESGDPTEAAANLFAMLRALDETDCTGIAVMAVPPEGLGAAINDRLERAAAAQA